MVRATHTEGMGDPVEESVYVQTEPGPGEEFFVADYTSMYLQLATVEDNPYGSIQIEGTIDGEHWFSIGDPLTEDGTLEVVPRKLTKLRPNVLEPGIGGGLWRLTLSAFDRRTNE